MFANVDKTEKRVLLVASLVAVSHLLLVAYAAAFLNISVPTCQPNEKLFQKGALRDVGNNRFEVHYLAKMWNFEPKKLLLPVGATVDFFLGSRDVTHGFHINGTNVNLMAVPGVINKATHTFHRPGIYHIVCHEYCGFGHQNMTAQIEVTEKVNTAAMGEEVAGAGGGVELSALVAAGKQVYEEKGCVACHSLNGTVGVGPTFKGLWGRTEELQDGSKVAVDDVYLAESIKAPGAKLVKGFGPVMPTLTLTDDEINSVTEFIKTIK